MFLKKYLILIYNNVLLNYLKKWWLVNISWRNFVCIIAGFNFLLLSVLHRWKHSLLSFTYRPCALACVHCWFFYISIEKSDHSFHKSLSFFVNNFKLRVLDVKFLPTSIKAVSYVVMMVIIMRLCDYKIWWVYTMLCWLCSFKFFAVSL